MVGKLKKRRAESYYPGIVIFFALWAWHHHNDNNNKTKKIADTYVMLCLGIILSTCINSFNLHNWDKENLAIDPGSSLLWVLGSFSFWACLNFLWGYPGGLLVKNLPTNARRHIPWRRKWWPTSVFLSVKSHGQRSLASCSSWVAKHLYGILGN